MIKTITSNFILILLICNYSPLSAQEVWWEDLPSEPINMLRGLEVNIKTKKAHYIKVDFKKLKESLDIALAENDKLIPFELPNEHGDPEVFLIKASTIMAPTLQAKYPGIRSFSGYAKSNPSRKLNLDYNTKNWHAIISDNYKMIYFDAYTRPANSIYQIYEKQHCLETAEFTCELKTPELNKEIVLPRNAAQQIEQVVRNYRIAISATYGYTQFFGGTKEGALGGIVATINRINMIYERDLGIHLILVANNDTLIIDDPTEDIFKTAGIEGIENQTLIDDRIGSANYDLGHVFGISFGGFATLGSVCDDLFKADSFTGLQEPQGDPFDIDFVGHEIGHQFGGNHTFNGIRGSCRFNRFRPTAFEPGSGTTIMGYAGLCGTDDFAPNSDDYFHGGSIVEMNTFITTGGSTCGNLDTILNQAPIIELPLDGQFIPILTPFELEGTASDPENGVLSYCWEQVDIGNPAPLGVYGEGDGALFRSYAPVSHGKRIFPRRSDLLNNQYLDFELLPNRDRVLNFQLTVRDDAPGGGAISWDRVQYEVTDEAGPFRVVNVPNLVAGAFRLIEWDVANTDVAPVDADSVTIYLSIDGGLSYNYELKTTANDGREVVYIPADINTTTGRFKVKATNSIFFDINDSDITIQADQSNNNSLDLLVDIKELTFCSADTVRLPIYLNLKGPLDTSSLSLSVSTEGFGVFIEPQEGQENAFDLVMTGGDVLPKGTYNVEFVAKKGLATDTLNFPIELLTVSSTLNIELLNPSPENEVVSIQPQFNWKGDPLADDYRLEISLEGSFKNPVYRSALLIDTFFQLPTTLLAETLYHWRVTARNNTCNISTVTNTGRFQTEALICKVFSPRPNELPVAFNALPFIQSFIKVEDDVIIRDVNILNVQGVYPSPNSGLSFRLRSPEGPILEIVKKQETCTIGNTFNFSVDEQSSSIFIPCPNDQGIAIPSSDKISQFNGQNAKGTWSLNIFDDGGEGQLNSWSVEICFGASSITNITEAIKDYPQLNVYPNPTKTSINFKMIGEEMQQIIITDVAGRAIYQSNKTSLSEINIPTNNWDKGMYFYLILDGNNRLQSGKIVKN